MLTKIDVELIMDFNVEFHGVFFKKIKVETKPSLANVAPLIYDEDGVLIAVGFEQIKTAISRKSVNGEAMGCVIFELNDFESLHFSFQLNNDPRLLPVEFRYENKALFGGTTDYPIPTEIRDKVSELIRFYKL